MNRIEILDLLKSEESQKIPWISKPGDWRKPNRASRCKCGYHQVNWMFLLKAQSDRKLG